MVARRSKLIVRALLLVLLFAVQALCHAHAIDHHFDGDSAACVVCSTSGNLDDAVRAYWTMSSGLASFTARPRPSER